MNQERASSAMEKDYVLLTPSVVNTWIQLIQKALGRLQSMSEERPFSALILQTLLLSQMKLLQLLGEQLQITMASPGSGSHDVRGVSASASVLRDDVVDSSRSSSPVGRPRLVINKRDARLIKDFMNSIPTHFVVSPDIERYRR
jgi:hypothetical protein